jgi:hypothetical protein
MCLLVLLTEWPLHTWGLYADGVDIWAYLGKDVQTSPTHTQLTQAWIDVPLHLCNPSP